MEEHSGSEDSEQVCDRLQRQKDMAMPEQIQELLGAVQGLSQEMQNLKNENMILKQMVTTWEQPPNAELPPMPCSLGKFNGTSKKVKEFLDACTVHFTFRPTTFASNQAKVGYLISNMTGNTLAWTTPLVTGTNPILQDYERFKSLLRQTFE
ncbi:protein LDOC1-like [Ambystoma mexicanum]|uniref:protein LDOC1-like n=1 Tax=Ambystoma mexicanum TaxID=8296 RepID=UPI0037E73C48